MIADRIKLINHKCVLFQDVNGKKINDSNPVLYDMMNSTEKKDEPNFIYIGFGTAHSCYSTETKREIPLSGTGHFYIYKKNNNLDNRD